MNYQQKFPFELEKLLRKIEGCKRIMVLGGLDTGKTTLIRALQEKLGGKVIDGDLGQPQIGPPGLISLGNYGERIEDAYFVGSFTPRGNLVQVITGFAKILKLIGERCFIDTDGWIEGEAAAVYKGELISLVEPDALLLLQREDELEKFATFSTEGKTIRLRAQKSREKTRGERSANRIRKFKYYFSHSRRVKKKWGQFKIAGSLIGLGEKIADARLQEEFNEEILAGWKYGNLLSVISGTRVGTTEKVKREFEVKKIERQPRDKLKYRLVGCHKGRDFVGEATITQISSEGIELLAPESVFDLIKPGKERIKPSGRSVK